MKCEICERGCEIPENGTGACGLYENNGQVIVERFPNKYLITCPISIETMPMLHFYIGQKFLQISTVGCNFHCPGCISTVIVKEMNHKSKALKELSPMEIVNEAIKNNCIGIAFLMNDPIASFYTFIKVAEAAKKRKLLVGCSSNTYFTEDALNKIIKYLDFINIGVKGMSDDIYRKCGGSTVNPVIRNMKILHDNGVFIEVSCVYSNENKEQVIELAKKISEISKDIPLQIMRFIPLEEADCSLEPSIKASEELIKQLMQYVNYVYLFNSPGTDFLNTYCPKCGKLIYKRDFYGPMGAKLISSELVEKEICPRCSFKLNFKGSLKNVRYQEADFQGGYPFTRALEIMESILITIGVSDKDKIVKVWEDVLCSGKLKNLHMDIQNLNSYIDTIRNFGKIAGYNNEAENLSSYMEERISIIQRGLANVKNKPKVYYAMGKPLFCIKGGRMENQLIEAAGGISVNKELDCSGRPGMRISVEQLNKLNPDIIFISAFISNSVEDFYDECIKDGINVEAVKNKRIYTHIAPGLDFGSPRWILGLMYMANILHPDIFNFNVIKEVEQFYQKFYNIDFTLANLNRSFAKPSNKWKLNS
ncbi:radical SAM protein [Thermoanaerobacterium sp. RBIITD]|uniref:radical SAM protein n=1 Tax=Thermoanaerobacterium sp. RBIITD TaxID=1550240 RepID=UPI000BB8FC83|nr:radical SAM protein [Thermoanaerobacterium sp. RBIITD]SNX54954.1 Pyruvate-formate lyase-activating enzyme [Thermoanaerobacterium sp. RBIITD]